MENGNDNRPAVKDRLKKKEATRNKVRITMSSDIADALSEAEEAHSLAQMSLMQNEEDADVKRKLVDAEENLRVAKEAAIEDSIEFVFRNVGRKAFDLLIDQHAPTAADRKEAEKQGGNPDSLQWSPSTFPQALVAASIIHPKMTQEEVQEIWDDPDWGGDELTQLFYCALGAQQKSRIVRMGNA